MAVRQYIGARYVPIFGRPGEESIQWDNTKPYEPLTVVLYQGNSYTSRQFVPVGIEITNEAFWAETGNYNAQVEQYRQEVLGFDAAIGANAEDIVTLKAQTAGTAESALKTAIDTNADNIATHTAQLAGTTESGLKVSIDNLIDQLAGTTESGLKTAIDANAYNIDTHTAQLAGTTESGLKTAIDANADNINTHTAQLAGTTESGLGTLLASVNARASRLLLGGTVMPAYMGSFEGDEQNSCCVRVGNDLYTFSVNNYDGMGTVRVWNLTGNTLVSARQALLGHGNSVAYDTVRECIWIAPMATYIAGVATKTNVIYRYNLNFTAKTELSCPERVYGLSFDPVTNTLYAFATSKGTEQVRIYAMGATEDAFTLRHTISNPQFAHVGYTNILAWQDFAVYDSTAIMAWSDGTCYVVDLSAGNPSIVGTIRISHLDVAGLWKYGELEGIEFDTSGRLYGMQQCPCGFTNTGMHFQHSIGFVTEINTQHMASQIECNLMNVYGSVTMVADTIFGLNRSEVHSPNELLWRLDSAYSRLVVPAGSSFTFDRVRVLKDLVLEINGSLTINNIIDISAGNFFLYINGGTLHFNTPTGYHCITNTSKSGTFAIRSNNGHLEVPTERNLFNAGYTPMLICIGVLDNIESVRINNVERGANTMCMGSYQVWIHS